MIIAISDHNITSSYSWYEPRFFRVVFGIDCKIIVDRAMPSDVRRLGIKSDNGDFGIAAVRHTERVEEVHLS